MSSWQLADYSKVPEISCVYTIAHEASGREYIGRSVNLKDRARKHWQELISGKHKNPKFSRTFEKYGPAFVIRPIVVGSVEYCTLIEDLNKKRSERMSGDKNPMFGRKHTDEARAVQSAAAKRQAMRNKGLF